MALDADFYATLPGRLEYADLREIEAILVNKALWELFQPRFQSKGEDSHYIGDVGFLPDELANQGEIDEWE